MIICQGRENKIVLMLPYFKALISNHLIEKINQGFVSNVSKVIFVQEMKRFATGKTIPLQRQFFGTFRFLSKVPPLNWFMQISLPIHQSSGH
jgi:hypothetical protein